MVLTWKTSAELHRVQQTSAQGPQVLPAWQSPPDKVGLRFCNYQK
jgi:hypothetical protein